MPIALYIGKYIYFTLVVTYSVTRPIYTFATEYVIASPVVIDVTAKLRKHICVTAALQTLVPKVREHPITGSNQSPEAQVHCPCGCFA